MQTILCMQMPAALLSPLHKPPALPVPEAGESLGGGATSGGTPKGLQLGDVAAPASGTAPLTYSLLLPRQTTLAFKKPILSSNLGAHGEALRGSEGLVQLQMPR